MSLFPIILQNNYRKLPRSTIAQLVWLYNRTCMDGSQNKNEVSYYRKETETLQFKLIG